MRRSAALSLFHICAGIGVALFSSVDALAAEIAVAPAPGALAAAIAAAKTGDTLMLSPGRHDGPVTLAKTLALVGREGATISAGGKGSVITVDAPDCRIEGLIIEDSGRSGVDLDAGVKLTAPARRARVERNVFNNNLVGVDVHGAPEARVVMNEINGILSARMNDRGNGVYVWNAPGAVIAENRITGGRDGIFLNTSRNNLIAGNAMTNLRFAVHYMYTLDSRILDNVSTGNHLGFALMFSSGLVVAGNRSVGDRDHGVMLNFVNDSEIRANEVKGGAEKCLFVYNANKNAISRNRFEGCRIGVHFTAGSAGNVLYENAFIANRNQVKFVGSTTHEWSRDGVGNYWSDQAAYDINGDGFADQPFRPNGAMDQILWTQPAARLLLGSPAFQIIRWAQSSFPSLLPGGVIDSAPLMRPIDDMTRRRQDYAGH